MTTPPQEYKIGYGRPPLKTRWKKGESGNPHRKSRKRSNNTVEIIDRLFQDFIQVTVHGKTTRITALEAIIIQLSLKEISGNRRALRVRLKYQEFAVRNSERRTAITFIDNAYTRALAAAGATHG
jgi:hypothetical protein